MAGLKVVWRNPKAAPREQRWHELACDFGRRLYVVEELVPQGDKKRWAQSLAFEVVSGGGAVTKTKKPTWMEHILQGAGSGGW
jgi:hypothetical protein